MESMKDGKHERLQKHIILVNSELWEYQNRIQHVNKPLHATYELHSCLRHRVMAILRKTKFKNKYIYIYIDI